MENKIWAISKLNKNAKKNVGSMPNLKTKKRDNM